MADLPLQRRKVIVTGGLGALGRGVGELLSARGASVVLLDKAPTPIDAAIAAAIPSVRPEPVEGPAPTPPFILGGVDLGDAHAAAAAFAQATEHLGGLDALINVAGGFAWETLADGNLDTWDRLYAMNLRSAVAASQHALPYLLKSPAGRIVNIGALASQKAGAGMGAYAASKAGVARLTESLAEELKERGVTVNAVLPSILDTPANRADMPDADASKWVTPAALAAVIAFLISDDAAAITGALIPVAGRV